MRRATFAALCLLLSLPAVPAMAERETLGFGRLFSNDFFGDGRDRWRAGSYSFSIVRGPAWNGTRPDTPGAILEYRFRNDILQPSDLDNVGSEDRPYVGALTFGLHTHFADGPFEISLGADLTAVGPQTGVSDVHEWFHDIVDAPEPQVAENQLPDAVYLSTTAEFARSWRLSERITLRPFFEVQTGTEDLLRIGGDLILGSVAHEDLLIRDRPTGHLYRGTEDDRAFGFSWVMGADYAYVADSAWLPESRGVARLDNRSRVRTGLHWQIAQDTSFFYGLTYLSEEFEGQPEGQLLGSLKLNFNF